jgi:hypothetical protein
MPVRCSRGFVASVAYIPVADKGIIMSRFTKMAKQWVRERTINQKTGVIKLEETSAPPTQAELTQENYDPLAHDPAEWREPFIRWLDIEAVWNERCTSSVKSLYDAFCDWAIKHDDVPCTRRTFEAMLDELGRVVVNGMLSGLILLRDLEESGYLPDVVERGKTIFQRLANYDSSS